MLSDEKSKLTRIPVQLQDSLRDDDSLSLKAFKQHLKRYKGAGYESAQIWYQSQRNLPISINLIDED